MACGRLANTYICGIPATELRQQFRNCAKLRSRRGAVWRQSRSVCGEDIMMFRTTLCCAALAMGLLIGLERSRALRPAKATDASSRSPSISCSSCASRPPARASPSHGSARRQATAELCQATAKRRGSAPGDRGAEKVRPGAGGSRHSPSHRSRSRTPSRRQSWRAPIQSLSTAPPMRLRPKRRARPSPSGPEVQLVDAEDINDIDRKADEHPCPVEQSGAGRR